MIDRNFNENRRSYHPLRLFQVLCNPFQKGGIDMSANREENDVGEHLERISALIRKNRNRIIQRKFSRVKGYTTRKERNIVRLLDE